jgi:hypothetical protein
VQGTVEGWRAWIVSRNLPRYGVPMKLKSVTHGAAVNDGYWPPRKENVAFCDRCGEDVPGEQCSCGFYSAKTLDHLMSMGYHTYRDTDDDHYFKVIGQVANWGKVIEGTQGWRSQYSYPVRLFVPFEAARHARLLKEAYGCKVRLLNFLKPAGSIDQQAITR